MIMIIRSKAPLRLGFAGGGSDVSPYSDLYGGLILNATINQYAYCTIEETDNDKIEIIATDLEQIYVCESTKELPINSNLDLHKGVYNRIVRDYGFDPMSFRITTYSDAPAGSGLGSSSTMVVAILKAFVEWKNLPLSDYEISRMAYEIERIDLNLSGGKQDQYAATFGGFNFMEFHKDGTVIVNPLRIKKWFINELEASILLYYTGASRSSAVIIDEQKKNTSGGNAQAIEAMHRIKQSAIDMKMALLTENIAKFAYILSVAWEDKKKMAANITNPMIQEAMNTALSQGAIAGKVSGAGGGGFIMFVVKPTHKLQISKVLAKLGGQVMNFQFVEGGTRGWKIYN
jgi:D-glycero-alpha-D-manno-heptose-7-phosphate kinase